MVRSGRRSAGAVNIGAAGAVVLLGAALAPQMAAAAKAPTAAECRAISDFDQRGQCWDALDKANQVDAQATKKREFGLGLHLPSGAAIKPKKEAVAEQARREKEEVRNLTLTLASVDSTALGRLLMTADDGAVWEVTDSDTVDSQPKPGDTVQVSKGMLGGYMCQLSRWQSLRCQRDQ